MCSGSPFGIGEYLSAQDQADAIESAANLENDISQQAIDLQLEMWEQAQSDFAPFLELGHAGVDQLVNNVPEWLNQTVAPYYNDLMQFNYSQQPQASNYMIDPVTGQQYSSPSPVYAGGSSSFNETPSNAPSFPAYTMPGNEMQSSSSNALGLTLPATRSGAPDSFSVYSNTYADEDIPQVSGAYIDGQWVNQADLPSTYTGELYSMDDPNYTPSYAYTNSMQQGNMGSRLDAADVFQYTPLQQQQRTDLTVPNLTANYETGGVLSPLVPDFQRQLEIPEFQRQLDIPEFQRELDIPDIQRELDIPDFQRSLEDFEMDTSDPYYQTRLAQKNESINAFLAKNGLANSTAGETYRQRELDDFNAGEFDRQYGLALTERDYMTNTDLERYGLESANRDYLTQTDIDQYNMESANRDYLTQTDIDRYNMQVADRDYLTQTDIDRYNMQSADRDYLTQTDIDKYNLEAARGSELYNRTQNQLDQLYNRQLSSTATNDANRLSLLASRYGLGTEIYNTLYGNALDYTNIGQGTASATGNNSAATGQSVSNTMMNNAANQANAMMAQSSVYANYMNGLNSQGSNVASSIMDYMNGNNSGGYYGSGNNYSSYYGGDSGGYYGGSNSYGSDGYTYDGSGIFGL